MTAIILGICILLVGLFTYFVVADMYQTRRYNALMREQKMKQGDEQSILAKKVK